MQTCWWYGWSTACRWRRGRTHPLVGKTWWMSGSHQERWWTTCRWPLNLPQHRTRVCAAAQEGNEKHQDGIQLHGHRCKRNDSCLFLGISRRGNRCLQLSVQNNSSSTCTDSVAKGRKTCLWKVTVCYLKTRLLPWFRDLLLWNRCPCWLTVPLLLEFSTESLLDVVHVECTDCWAGDAVEGTTKEVTQAQVTQRSGL